MTECAVLGGCSSTHAAQSSTQLTTGPRAGEGESLVAQARGRQLAVFPQLGSRQFTLLLASPNHWGTPLVLLVVEDRGAWLKALLPVRPNGSEGWIRESDVTLSKHAYRIRIELQAHRITVLHHGRVLLQEPVAVGTLQTPTPGGQYYTTDLLKQPNPIGPYGPYAYGLSGYSRVLTEFGGGDGQLGLHGTNDPASLGTDVSHGCIRMSNAGITRLAGLLPLGVPVEVDP